MATTRWIEVPQAWVDHFASRSTVEPPTVRVYWTPEGGGARTAVTDSEYLLSCDPLEYSIDFHKYGGLGKGRDTNFTFTQKTDFFTATFTQDMIGCDIAVAVRWGLADADDFATGWRTVFCGRLVNFMYNDDRTVTLTAHHHFEWHLDNMNPEDWYAFTGERYCSKPIRFKGAEPGAGTFILNDQVDDTELWEDTDLTNFDANWPKTFSCWVSREVDEWWWTDAPGASQRARVAVRNDHLPPYADSFIGDNPNVVTVFTQGHTISGTWDTDIQSGLNWAGAFHPLTKETPYPSQWAFHNDVHYCITPPSIKYVDGTGFKQPFALIDFDGVTIVSGGVSAYSGPLPEETERDPRGNNCWKVRMDGTNPEGEGSVDITHPFYLPDRVEIYALTEANPDSGNNFQSWRKFGIRQLGTNWDNISPGCINFVHVLYEWYPWKVKNDEGNWLNNTDGRFSYANAWGDISEINQGIWWDAREYPGDEGKSWPSGTKESPWLKVCYCPGLRQLTGASGLQHPGGVITSKRDEPCQLIYGLISKVWGYGRPAVIDLDGATTASQTGSDVLMNANGYAPVTGSFDNSYSWVSNNYYNKFVNRWPGTSRCQHLRGLRVGLSEDDLNPKATWKNAIEMLARGLGFYVYSAPFGGVDVWTQVTTPGAAGAGNWTFSSDLDDDAPEPGDQTTRNAWDVDYDWHGWKTVRHVLYKYRALTEITIPTESAGYAPTGVMEILSEEVHKTVADADMGLRPKNFGLADGLIFDLGTNGNDTTQVDAVAQDILDLYASNYSDIKFTVPITCFWDENDEYLLRIGNGFSFQDSETGVSSTYWITGFALDLLGGTIDIQGVSTGADPAQNDFPEHDPVAMIPLPLVNFGEQKIGTTGSGIAGLFNIGGGLLTGAATISGDPEFGWYTGSGLYSLRSNEAELFGVTFTPTGTAAKTAVITLLTGTSSVISMTGSGYTAIGAGETDLTFAAIGVGEWKEGSWVVTNTSPNIDNEIRGTVSLTNDNDGTAFAFYNSDPTAKPKTTMFCAAQSGTAEINISFTPVVAGLHTGVLYTPFPAPHNEILLSGTATTSGVVTVSGTPVADDYARFVDTETVEGRSVAQMLSDLNVEFGADATDATNVAAAGAFMESEANVKGDIFVADANDSIVRHGIGTDGQVLTADSGGLDGVAWEAPTTGTVDTSGTPAANDIARFTDTDTIEGRSYAELKADLDLEIGTDVLAQQTIGIADDNLVEMDDADAADNDFAKFTANGLEGRSYAETLSDIGAMAVHSEDTNTTLCSDGSGGIQAGPMYLDTSTGKNSYVFPGHYAQYLEMVNGHGLTAIEAGDICILIGIGTANIMKVQRNDTAHGATWRTFGIALEAIAVGATGKVAVDGFCDAKISGSSTVIRDLLSNCATAGSEHKLQHTWSNHTVGMSCGRSGSNYYNDGTDLWVRVQLNGMESS